MSKRMNENMPSTKTKDLGGGQKLTSYFGKDSSDMRDVTPMKMPGGSENYSAVMPKSADKGD